MGGQRAQHELSSVSVFALRVCVSGHASVYVVWTVEEEGDCKGDF